MTKQTWSALKRASEIRRVGLISFRIWQTSLWKGANLIKSCVDFCKALIWRRATVPGRKRRLPAEEWNKRDKLKQTKRN